MQAVFGKPAAFMKPPGFEIFSASLTSFIAVEMTETV